MALRGEGIYNSGYIYRKWGMNPMALKNLIRNMNYAILRLNL